MSVKYIMQQTGGRMGMDPADANMRAILVDYIQRAAEEIYEQVDIPGTLKQCLFNVSGNQQLALPPTVGNIRGMRQYTNRVPWNQVSMVPHFAFGDWKNCWRTIRKIGYSPLKMDLQQVSPLTLSVGTVESEPVVVTISGSTYTSSLVTDVITLDSTEKVGAVDFSAIKAIRKDSRSQYNVSVKDADGNEVADIPNNMLESRYLLIDVSEFPWSTAATDDVDQLLEVLYKETLPLLVNDEDEFPAPDYDNVIVDRVLELWYEEQGKTEQALALDTRISRTIGRKIMDDQRGEMQKVQYQPNEHDNMFFKPRFIRRNMRRPFRSY